MAKKYQHWHYQIDDDNICWLSIDKADSGTNVLSDDIMVELDRLIDEIQTAVPKGLVIDSAKKSGFIAGADVKGFTHFKDEAEALATIQRAHGIFNRLEALPFPTIALIHGFCLGGGMELALACRYRIADNDPKTRLGLPEVKLGIHPGFGGTVRCLKLIGAPSAMDIMLSGRAVSARAAQKMGLVNYAVPYRHLKNAARGVLAKPPKVKKLPLWVQLLNHKQVRPWLAKYLEKKVAKRATATFNKKTPDKPRFVTGAIGPTNRTASLSPNVSIISPPSMSADT